MFKHWDKSDIVKAVFFAIVVLEILAGVVACSVNSQSFQRGIKDIKSDFGGGLERTLTVYTANGEVLKTYEGWIDLATTEGGIVKFDFNGQRIMYYNCYIEVIEKGEEE